MQFTISIFLLGSAIAQLCTGPIIERYSYQKIALIASALFIFSSLFCAFSSSIFLFINARFLQALATGTLAIIARASLSKKFSAQKTVSIYLLISPILAFSLAFSPFIGGYLNTYLGWQSIFYFLALLGLLLFYLCFRYLFIPQNQNELININIKTVIHTYSQLLKNNLYVACAIGLSAALAQITAFLSEIPFLFHQLGYDSSSIGKFYILYSITFILGSYFTRKTISYFKFNTLVYIGFIYEFIAIMILFILSFFPIQYAYEIFSPTFFSGIGNGILVALLTGKAISLFKRQSGYAAGFISALAFFASML